MKLTKNAGHNKDGYNGYNIGFDVSSRFLLSNGERGKNFVIYANNSLLVKYLKLLTTDNRKTSRLVWYVYDFTVSYEIVDVSDIVYIDKCLTKKYDTV